MSTESNKELVRTLIQDGWNGRHLDDLEKLLSKNYVEHNPSLPVELQKGLEGARASMTAFQTAFPDMRATIDEITAEGDRVTCRWTMTGRNDGPFMGLAPTNRPASITGISTYRIERDRIAEGWTNGDMLGLLQQIGAAPTLQDTVLAQSRIAIVRRVLDEAYGRGNLGVIDEAIASDYRASRAMNAGIPASEVLRQTIAGLRKAFPDLQVSIEDIAATGDRVIVRSTFRGTHKGEFRGIAPTGKRMTMRGMAIIRFSGDRAIEGWYESDYLGLLQQLGVLETPALLRI